MITGNGQFPIRFCFGGGVLQVITNSNSVQHLETCEIRFTSTPKSSPQDGQPGSTGITRSSNHIRPRSFVSTTLSLSQPSTVQRSVDQAIRYILALPEDLRWECVNSMKPPFFIVIYRECPTKATLHDRVHIGYIDYPTSQDPSHPGVHAFQRPVKAPAWF